MAQGPLTGDTNPGVPMAQGTRTADPNPGIPMARGPPMVTQAPVSPRWCPLSPPPHRSIDGLLRPQKRNAHVPLWNYTLLRAQVGGCRGGGHI